MIQGLANRLHQPIAMFASKGPVKGNYKLACVLVCNLVYKSILF